MLETAKRKNLYSLISLKSGVPMSPFGWHFKEITVLQSHAIPKVVQTFLVFIVSSMD